MNNNPKVYCWDCPGYEVGDCMAGTSLCILPRAYQMMHEYFLNYVDPRVVCLFQIRSTRTEEGIGKLTLHLQAQGPYALPYQNQEELEARLTEGVGMGVIVEVSY